MFLEEDTKDSNGGALAVKSLFSVYRMWSEDRGEKAMTQIAFQRKLSDRGLDIIGQGSRAEIQNMVLIPKAVPTSTDVNWDAITRFNRF